MKQGQSMSSCLVAFLFAFTVISESASACPLAVIFKHFGLPQQPTSSSVFPLNGDELAPLNSDELASTAPVGFIYNLGERTILTASVREDVLALIVSPEDPSRDGLQTSLNDLVTTRANYGASSVNDGETLGIYWKGEKATYFITFYHPFSVFRSRINSQQLQQIAQELFKVVTGANNGSKRSL